MTDARIQIIAEDAVALRVDTAMRAQMLAVQLRQTGNWREVVPGLNSVTIRFDPAITDLRSASQQLINALDCNPGSPASTPDTLEIPVQYGGANGPDLSDICARLKLSETAFIARHSAPTYRAEMIGFTPGFAYLGGLDEALVVARRTAPRNHVPAGSIGISGLYSGLYAMPGPGGWPLIGRTDKLLFNAGSDDPFVIQPGQLIRFVPV